MEKKAKSMKKEAKRLKAITFVIQKWNKTPIRGAIEKIHYWYCSSVKFNYLVKQLFHILGAPIIFSTSVLNISIPY